MNTFLSECFDILPETELKRLQILLRMVLKKNSDREGIRRAILDTYRRKGKPEKALAALPNGGKEQFLDLMNSFGVKKTNKLEKEEIYLLEKNPFVFWPKNNLCLISGEAHYYFSECSEFKEQGYLFAYLRNLNNRERKSWAQWLGINVPIRTESERSQKIYQHISDARFGETFSYDEINYESLLKIENENPVYLDDIFPDNPLQYPISWFYRGVISFYDSLARMEKIEKLLSVKECVILKALKYGKIIIRSETPGFGMKERFRLIGAKEKICRDTYPAVPEYFVGTSDEKLLF